MARVLVSDKLADEGLAVLEAAPGIEVDHRPGIEPDELARVIGDYEGWIVRSATKPTAELIGAASKLRVIGRAGIGVDNIDLAAATARGVVVMNTPEGNAITTAEHAISLIMSLARRIPQATASLRAGEWTKERFQGRELFGQTLGIVGLGNIGSIVADRARGLRMRVIACDPLVTEERAQRLGVDLVSFDELMERADIITVHVSLTNETRGLIGRKAFEKAKRGLLIVNAARGGIVDEAALLEAIESGVVAGAALDVFETEPPPPDHPLLARDEVIATPHLGAATEQAQLNVAIAIAEQVRDYLLEGVVRNSVNLPSVSAERLDELRPWLVLCERLGRFLGQISRGGLQEVDVEYAGDVAQSDVQPLTLAVLKGLLEPWVGERVNFVNAPHVAQQHGIRVIESKAAEPEDFVSLVTIRLQTQHGPFRLSGTLIGRTQPRIVRIDDFLLEAVPEGATLLIRNTDRPGVVGHVGSLLAGAGINISRMQLALDLGGEHALQLLNVDPSPPAELLAQLRALDGVEQVESMDLGQRIT